MLKSFTNFLAQAAEVTTNVLVGQQPKDVEFQSHWKTITCLISASEDTDTESCILEINAHLDRMVDLLSQEDGSGVSMGPCMELMIRHKMLDTLCATGKSDYPAGMRKSVFNFFCLLLTRVQQPLLPHIAVHRPINNLVRTCGLSLVNPLAVDEVQFLRTICSTLHTDPTLSNFFIEDEDVNKQESTFVVAEALMRISNSEDNLVCLKAFECLLLCVSLKTVSDILANSQFPLLLASKMRQHLQLLPNSLSYVDVLNRKAGWGINYASSTAIQCLSPSPHQPLIHLEAYLSWLDYCEQIISGSPKVLQDSVCKCVKELVMETVLLPKISLTSEIDLVTGLALLTKTLISITHKRFIQEFIQFISTHVTKQLIVSCNHLNEDVCCTSLILLQTLFSLPLSSCLLPLSEKQSIDKRQLENTVKSYLSIIPSHLLTAHEVGGDSELVYYLVEAYQQVYKSQQLINELDNTCVQTSLISDEEHSLITALLDRLERILDQSYDLNLHLTSVLSHLASFPHMDKLFVVPQTDNSDSSKVSYRNVYTILNKVSLRLQNHADRSPGLQLNIIEARRRLAGQETSDLLSMPNNELLEGAVLLEEFCKELAAILYCRNSLSFLSSTGEHSIDNGITGDNMHNSK